jgi:hypothetical protein
MPLQALHRAKNKGASLRRFCFFNQEQPVNDNTRIELTDNVMDAAIKLSDGNPGAIAAIMKMMEHAPTIDPYSAFGAMGPLLSLDTHGIYGSEIWILWKNICGMDAVKAQTLFRSVQLGIMPERRLTDAARSGLSDFDFADLLEKVKTKLPNFAAVHA